MSLISKGDRRAVQVTQVRSIIAESAALEATAYLLVHEDCGWLEGGTDRFESLGIDVENESEFVLELVHPADFDGVYRVEFREGEPVGSARDD